MSFFLFGLVVGTWASRVPAIKAQTGLNNAQLGLALLAAPLAITVAAVLTGRASKHFGSARLIQISTFLTAIAMLAPVAAHGFISLTVAVAVMGLPWGMFDISVNTHASVTEHLYGRPIISSFHAFWSLGGLVGAATGALAAYCGLSLAQHFGILAISVIFVGIFGLNGLVPHSTETTTHVPGSDGSPKDDRWTKALVLLGLIALCSFVGEGAAADWSAIYLHEQLHTSTGAAAIGYAAFAIAMTASRFAGDTLAARFGHAKLLRFSGLIAGLGLAAGLATNLTGVAIAGWMALGLGLAAVAPIAFGAAGSLPGVTRGRAIAKVGNLGYIGIIGGPPVIGLTSQAVGLRAALFIPVLLALCIVLMAPAAARRSSSSASQRKSGQIRTA